MIDPVNLNDKLALFSEHFAPHTVAQCNGHDVMVVKVLGEFVWHKHDDTDDVFLVLSGRLIMRLRDREVVIGPASSSSSPAASSTSPTHQWRPTSS